VIELRVRRKQGDFVVDTAFISEGVGVTALFGESGAGKTSVINMVAGLVRPEEGRIVVNGSRLFDSEKGVDVPPERRRIGYIFQDGRLFPHLSVRSNLSYGMRLIPAAERRVGFDQVVALLGIDHLLARRPAKLSGGEKQRIAIGRALLTNPSLLLMDEPLASLDRARKSEVLPFIGRLSRELSIPILYVTHSLDEILNLADTMVLMDTGRAVAVGRVEDLMSRLDLRQLAGHSQGGSVLSTVVEIQDDAFGLTHLRFRGGVLKVPQMDQPTGTAVRVRIDARSVAIALKRPDQISVQNIFQGTIEEIVEDNGALVDVRLNIGCPLLARITPRAKADLGLIAGQQVFALIKSVAISRGE
jgi:molybdate transport system ATP-binding protein